MSEESMSSGSTVAGGPPGRQLDQKSLGRLIVGVVGLAGSIGYLVMAIDMPTGSMDSPGPGMFPIGVGVLAVVVSLIVIGEGLLKSGPTGDVELPVRFERRQALYFLGTLVAYILLLPLLGQYVAASLYVIATLKLLGGLSWVRSILVGLAMGIGVSALFGEVLDVSLPSGIW